MENKYIEKEATKAGSCFVCKRPSTAVLTLFDNSNADAFYICRSHLLDANFCSRIDVPPPSKSVPKSTSPTSQKKKDNQSKQKPESNSFTDLVSNIGSAVLSWRDKSDQDKKEDTTSSDKKDKKDDKETSSTSSSPTASPKPLEDTGPEQPSKPIIPIYALHRSFYYLRKRQYELKKKKTEVSKMLDVQLPEVPKTKPRLGNN